ncbi:MAG: hypothetical protein KDH16_18890 [Rhodocyclaceae bacterium]|nr:hypothetical protein [Rhodocyclaceae bacterium]
MSEDIALEWKGVTHVVPEGRIMRLAADLEDILSSEDVSAWQRLKTPSRINIARYSMAYARALQAAGVGVTEREVWVEMFRGGKSAELMISAVEGLSMLMAPPEAFVGIETAPEEGADAPGKPAPRAAKRKPRKAPSRKRS